MAFACIKKQAGTLTHAVDDTRPHSGPAHRTSYALQSRRSCCAACACCEAASAWLHLSQAALCVRHKWSAGGT
eukprot:scaffold227379_cov18-Tisochrysis_lutea.AAC.1